MRKNKGPTYFRPVIPLLFSFMTGIIIALYVPGLWIYFALLAFITFIYIIYTLRSDRITRVSPLILFICLGYLSLISWGAGALSPGHVAYYTGDRFWEVTGTVESEPVNQSYRQKCVLTDLKLERLSVSSLPFPVKGRIQLSIYGKEKKVSMGDRIRVATTIRPFRSFKNPGGFDYERYMKFQGIWRNAYTSDYKIKILPQKSRPGFSRIFTSLRENISNLIDQSLQKESKAVMTALILGERQQISPSLKQAFNRAGVSHLLAISGLHIGIVASVSFFFFKWLLSFFKPLLMRAWAKKGVALLSIFPVLLYGTLAGMSPSTQRAVIMVLVFLMTFLIERDHNLINTVAIAAMIILIISPPSLFSVSFQLSFIAVISIILGITLLKKPSDEPADKKFRWLRPVYGMMLASVFAIIGTMPVIMYYFNQIQFAGFFSNLILIPLIGFIAVPAGLFSVLVLYPISAKAAVWGLGMSGKVLDVSISIIHYLSNFSFSAIKTISPSILEIICFYLILWSCLYLFRRPFEEKTDRLSKRKVAIAALVTALFVLSLDVSYWIHKRFLNTGLTAIVMDVGQGNAAVLELPRGHVMVIDGGGFGDNSTFDTGKSLIAPFLWHNKIRTVDTVILTHPDSDHLNGLLYILDNFHVKKVLSNHQASDSEPYQEFINLIKKNHIDQPEFKNISRINSINGVTFEILNPPINFNPDNKYASSQDINNNSMVIKAGFGKFSILFPGDIMKTGEQEITANNTDLLKSTVLIAPHHGSNTSSTPAFLNAVDPEAVIISSGKPDRFPSQTVLDRYRNRNFKIFRTDQNGAVIIKTNGKTMSIDPVVGERAIIDN